MKGRPHISTLCECVGCQHYDAAQAVVRMLNENWCLGAGVLGRIQKDAAAGDATQKKILDIVEGLIGPL